MTQAADVANSPRDRRLALVGNLGFSGATVCGGALVWVHRRRL